MTASTNKAVLIVDDDAAVTALISELARRLHFDVFAAENSMLFKHALLRGQPQLIFLDLHMGDTDGVECLRHLANQGCQAEIILVSGFEHKVLASAQQFGRSLGLRVTTVLRKPVRVHELEEVMARYATDGMSFGAADIQRAIEEYELVLHYQPILHRLPDAWPIGSVEALVRWRHPQYGLLLPSQFLPEVEREGMMSALTDFVLREGLRQVGHWYSRGWHLGLTVNLPASCIADVHFPDRLQSVLNEYGVPAHHLCFDVTEGALVGEHTMIMDSFARLRVQGVELALDDFGVGTSSLTQLYKLPYTCIKVDRALVKELATSAQARTIVSALIGLGHQLSLRVCAEGVELQEVFDLLERAGCDQMQGDLISAAVSPGELEGFLHKWNKDIDPASVLLAG